MKIAIPKFFVFVIMTIATSSCAAAVESSNTLTTKVEPSLDNEDKRATIIASSSSSSSSSLALSGATQKLSKSNKGSKTTPIVGYSRVTIQNDTPYQTLPRKTYSRFPQGITYVAYSAFCAIDYIPEGIVSGYMWTGPKRGGCLVTNIFTTLIRPENKGGNLTCTPYDSSAGTTHADYFIILIDNKCCVRSSYQSKEYS